MTKFKTRNLLLVVLSVMFAFALISFVATKSVNATDNTITANDLQVVDTCQIRAQGDERDGIRFTALVSEKAYESLGSEAIRAGVIVAKDNVSLENLNHEDLDPVTGYIDVEAVVWDESKNDPLTGAKAFNAVIYGLEGNYNTLLTARAYIQLKDSSYVYSEDVTTRSIAGVASELLANGSYTSDTEQTYRDYINEVDSIIKVNDEVVADGESLTLDVGQTLNVSVEPSNLVPTIGLYDDSCFVVDRVDDCTVITAKKATAGENNVQIVLGTKRIDLNVTVNEFVDNNRADGILVDFDEAGYESLVSVNPRYERSFYPQVLTGESALGANSGILGSKIGTYEFVAIELPEPIGLSNELGLYIKLKYLGSYADLYVDFLDENKESINTTATEFSDILVGELTFDGKQPADTDDWDSLFLSTKFISKKFDTSIAIKYISFVRYGTPEISTPDFYLDEIGLVGKTNWVDENVADETILADFNENEYLHNVTSSSTNNTSTMSILTGDAALAQGAPTSSGVLYYHTGNDTLSTIHVMFNKTFARSSVKGIKITFKTSMLGSMYFGLLDAEGNHLGDATKGGTNAQRNRLVSQITNHPLTNGAWNTLYIPIDVLNVMKGNEAKDVGGLEFYLNYTTGAIIIDEITTYSQYSRDMLPDDESLAPNVLADFNDPCYEYYTIGKIHSDSANRTDVLTASSEYTATGVDATSGVLQAKATSYYGTTTFFAKSFNLSNADYLYIIAKSNKSLNAGSATVNKVKDIQFIDANGNIINGVAQKTFYEFCMPSCWETEVVGEYNIYYLDTAKIKTYYGANAEIYGMRLYHIGSCDMWVDEVGIIPKGTDMNIGENVLADFEEEKAYTDCASWYKAPETPGVGITCRLAAAGKTDSSKIWKDAQPEFGVLYLQGNATDNVYNIKLQKVVNLANIDAITLRVYTDTTNLYTNWQGCFVCLYDAEGNKTTNANTPIEYKSTSTNGEPGYGWYTITIPVANLEGGSVSENLIGLTFDVYNVNVLIDEIGFVPKAVA